jgi:hypothetical protein
MWRRMGGGGVGRRYGVGMFREGEEAWLSSVDIFFFFSSRSGVAAACRIL